MVQRILSSGLLALMLAASAEAATAETAPAWPDSFTSRVEALALLQSLNADLLSHESATLTLDRWCGLHKLASPARITAEQVHGAQKSPTAEQRKLLGVSATEPVRYRRVRLHCGDRVLSEADNWYVPARLTPEMNQVLDSTDTSFGRVVQPLHFQRHTLAAQLLWRPLPEGWEMGSPLPSPGKTLQIPADVLQHRAVLTLPDGTPFSEVIETYKSDIFAFPMPRR